MTVPVARNDPCPCGSGKRFKECHGAVGASPGLPPVARPQAPASESRMLAALEAQRAGRIAEAGRLYQSVLDEDPDNFDALHMLGVVQYELGQLASAEALVRRAVALNPDYAPAGVNLELILAQQSRQLARVELEREVEAMVRAQSDAARQQIASDVRVIAFYLPQYHTIPENDRWWGEGFTEWTHVRRAVPMFAGHEQPHEPGELGYYDLRLPEVRERQAALAREFGVHGFCYHVYWFNGKRLLEQPLDEVAASGKPDFPFCICWANENWTRRWDGREQDVLIAQNYSEADSRAFIRHYLPLLADPRYIRVEGRPLLIVYRLDQVPHARTMAEIWREEARRFGLGDICLCAARTTLLSDPEALGFDAGVEFPPHGYRAYRLNAQLALTEREFRGFVFDYRDRLIQSLDEPLSDGTLFRAAMPAWDNTARRRSDGMMFVRSSPALFQYWLHALIEQTRRRLPEGKRLVFINAWNEWGEGCHLEPDRRHGLGYLRAVRTALASPTRDWPSPVPIGDDPEGALAACEQDQALTVRRFDRSDGTARDGPLVSVVMTSYNRARFLDEAVRSVFAQTYRHLELVVVDDGSSDDSFAMLAELARAAPFPMVLIRQPNAGAPGALNRGLSVARGELVALLDSDDAYLPTRIATLLAALRREGSMLAFSGVEFIDADGNPAAHPRAIELQEKIDAVGGYPNKVYPLVLSNVTASTGNLMFARELLALTGGFRDLRLTHDWDFALAATYAGEPTHVAAPLYRYRLHEGSASATLRLHKTEETEAVYRRFFAALDRHPLFTDRARREDFLRFAHQHGCRGYFPAPAAWRDGRQD